MANMVKTHLRVEPAPKLFLAKVMGSRSEVRGKSTRRVLRTIYKYEQFKMELKNQAQDESSIEKC